MLMSHTLSERGRRGAEAETRESRGRDANWRMSSAEMKRELAGSALLYKELETSKCAW